MASKSTLYFCMRFFWHCAAVDRISTDTGHHAVPTSYVIAVPLVFHWFIILELLHLRLTLPEEEFYNFQSSFLQCRCRFCYPIICINAPSIFNIRRCLVYWLVCWWCLCRDVRSGVVLARSSQPEVGWLGWRNTQDESLLQAIAVSCAMHCGSSTVTSELSHVDAVSSVVPSESLLLSAVIVWIVRCCSRHIAKSNFLWLISN